MKVIGGRFTLLAILFVVPITVACKEPDNEPIVQDLLPAPVQPPDVYIFNTGSADRTQKGILTLSDWTIDDQLIKSDLGLPEKRPVPLRLSANENMIVRFVSESAPHELEIRQFTDMDASRGYLGDPISTTEWQHPEVFSHHARDPMRLIYNSNPEMSGWEFQMDVPLYSGVLYMNIWAAWYEIPEYKTYSANWTVSVEKSVLEIQ
jgi:hypothetical protein